MKHGQKSSNSKKYLVMNPDSLVDPLKENARGAEAHKQLLSRHDPLHGRIPVCKVSRELFPVCDKFGNDLWGYEIRKIQSLALNFDFGKLYSGLMDLDARFGNVTQNARALYWAYSSGIRGTEKDLVKFTEIMSKTATTINSDGYAQQVDAATCES